jgi:hypothetical protein
MMEEPKAMVEIYSIEAPSVQDLYIPEVPRLPTPGKRIKYANKKRNQNKRF